MPRPQNAGFASVLPSEPRAVAALLRALLDTVREGAAVVTQGGVILYANPRFAELIGVDSEHTAGASLTNIVSLASREVFEGALSGALRVATQGEMDIETQSGDVRTIKVFLTPIRFAKETAVGITATDVTEMIEKERALRDSEASLHSLSGRILRLQDQERRGIARDLHDITGQELAFAVMTLGHLANTVEWQDAKARQSLRDTVEIIRKIEEEVRTLSYVLHPPLLDEFGLGSALNWYVEGFTKKSGIGVQIDCAKNLPRLSGEKETALFRVVQESLTNVLRHSGSCRARVRASLEDGQVKLSVRDEGYGIDRAILAKMSSAHVGTGVGIAGMRERVEQLGGTLHVRACVKGTEVVASLPVAEGETVAVDPQYLMATAGSRHRPLADAKSSGNKKRILIVDDHEVTRRGIRSLLEEEPDLEICGEAQDGFEAVHKTRELNPDLVIMDLTMPKVGGFSAASAIRNSGLAAKIIFFSVHGNAVFERMGQAAGFEGLVQKSNAAVDLIRAVRAILAGDRFYNSEVLKSRSYAAATPAAR